MAYGTTPYGTTPYGTGGAPIIPPGPSGPGITRTERKLAYMKLNGAVSDDYHDAQYEFLISQGVAARQISDMWKEFLNGQGLTGALQDMLHVFWAGVL